MYHVIYCRVLAAKSTDNANVKVIACKDAQTVSATDKYTLAYNGFTKCAEPFGILVAGSKFMTDFTVLDTARILAEMLDQDRDGRSILKCTKHNISLRNL